MFVVSRAALFLTLSKRVIIITPLRRKVRLFILNFLFSSLFCVTCLKTPVDKSTISRHFFIYIHFKEHVCHLQFRCFLGPKVPIRVLLSMRVRARVRLRVFLFLLLLLLFSFNFAIGKKEREKRIANPRECFSFYYPYIACVMTLTFFFFFLSLYISLFLTNRLKTVSRAARKTPVAFAVNAEQVRFSFYLFPYVCPSFFLLSVRRRNMTDDEKHSSINNNNNNRKRSSFSPAPLASRVP